MFPWWYIILWIQLLDHTNKSWLFNRANWNHFFGHKMCNWFSNYLPSFTAMCIWHCSFNCFTQRYLFSTTMTIFLVHCRCLLFFSFSIEACSFAWWILRWLNRLLVFPPCVNTTVWHRQQITESSSSLWSSLTRRIPKPMNKCFFATNSSITPFHSWNVVRTFMELC